GGGHPRRPGLCPGPGGARPRRRLDVGPRRTPAGIRRPGFRRLPGHRRNVPTGGRPRAPLGRQPLSVTLFDSMQKTDEMAVKPPEAEDAPPVPALDLKAQYRAIRPQVEEAVRRVLESQHFILGPEVEAFERELAAYVGCRHAVGVASGSDALLLSLMALDVRP